MNLCSLKQNSFLSIFNEPQNIAVGGGGGGSINSTLEIRVISIFVGAYHECTG